MDKNIFSNLRIVQSSLMAEYNANTNLMDQVGNRKFGQIMTKKLGRNLVPKKLWKNYDQPYLIYHSWLPGLIEISKSEMIAFKKLATQKLPIPESKIEKQLLSKIQKAGWLKSTKINVDQLAEHALETFIAVQNKYEFTKILKIAQKKKPRIIVEIGTARGGVFFALAQIATPDATLISIDLPGAPNCGGQTENERKLFSTFGLPTQKFHFIANNSRFHTTQTELKKILNGKKIDLLFIDGDHSYGGVASDFRMYRQFVHKNGLIAFHDICMTPEEFGPGCEVGVFWKEFKKEFKTKEIIDPKGICKKVVPDGVEKAWGIGLFNF